jgi:hypothetical protein
MCHRHGGIYIFIGFFLLCIVFRVSGNPIPVYLDPEPVYQEPGAAASSIDIYWLVPVFVIDFWMNVFVLYGGGLLLVCHCHRIGYVLDFSRGVFLVSVFFISLVGLLAEGFLGGWIGGLFLSLIFIFLSIIVVSRWLLRLDWVNSVIMGLFALFINVLVWTFFIIF